MPQRPHEYTIREWRPDLEAFATLIRETGVVKPWPRASANPQYRRTYMTVGDFEYWMMGAPIPKTTVINRVVPETDAA
jgi:hypothetical protein